MSKTRVVIGLAILTCALAASSPTADAFFEANTAGATSGPVAKFPASLDWIIQVGGTVVTSVICVPGTTETGLWQIQNSEETVVTSGTKEQKQPVTKVGPHEAITIANWGTCKAKLGASEAAATVSPCRLQVAQPGKSTVAGQAAFGSFQTDCVIKVPTLVCTITVEQLPVNHNLKTVNLTNVAAGVEYKINLQGITYKAEGAGCATVGLKEGKESSLVSGTAGNEGLIMAGQKLI